MEARGIGVVSACACAIVVLAATGFPGGAAAHERHRAAPAAAVVESARLAIDSTAALPEKLAVDSAAGLIGALEEAKEEPFRMPPFRDLLTEHLHNKIVHFPVALSIVAIVLLGLARAREEAGSAARVVILIAAAMAIAAYFTGRAQEEVFEGGPKEWLVEVHERWGTAASIALVGWGVLAAWKRSRAWWLGFGVAVAVVVAIAAFYGGLVAHGH